MATPTSGAGAPRGNRIDPADDPRSFMQLIRDLPGIGLELLRAEFERFKREMSRKAKNIGIGSLLFMAAGGTGLFVLGALVLAAVYALSMVVPTWAAALIVSGGLLVVTIILVLAGLDQFKRSQGMMPTETMDGIVEDAHAVKGEGRFDI
jgi:hypothetical protein